MWQRWKLICFGVLIVYVVLNVGKLGLGSVLLLIVCLLFVSGVCWQTRAQVEHSIETRGYTWSNSIISVSILPQENQSWWEPYYLDAALRGVAQWNDAIQDFASNYTEFSYLSGLRLVPTVVSEHASGFDIYIDWIDECELETTIGLTRLIVTPSCTAVNSTVCLAAKAPSGHVMTQVDMQNIVVHELGHNFGLSHCSYSEDVMYAVVQYRETVKPLSTLDLYAVSENFFWLSNSAQDGSSGMCAEPSLFVLPSNISYTVLPITKENLPVAVPQSFTDQAIEFVLRPEFLVALLIALVLLLVMVMIVARKRS